MSGIFMFIYFLLLIFMKKVNILKALVSALFMGFGLSLCNWLGRTLFHIPAPTMSIITLVIAVIVVIKTLSSKKQPSA